jgi:hypothetical protein
MQSTLEQATKRAKKWLKMVHELGVKDVELEYIRLEDNGHYLFHFTHPVTKKVATLSTHGYLEKDLKEFVFKPKVFWNGEWGEFPEITDWLDDDFETIVTFKPKTNGLQKKG